MGCKLTLGTAYGLSFTFFEFSELASKSKSSLSKCKSQTKKLHKSESSSPIAVLHAL